MEALNVIGRRIDNLSRILGPTTTTDTEGGENLVESLLSANTLISSAMSGRENVLKVVARCDELEQYLDPDFQDEIQSMKAKEVYVNIVAPELAANFEMLEKIKLLEFTLGAEYFRNIPDVSDKIKEMNSTAGELCQKNELIEESLILAMQRYSEIQSCITESLKAMNERLYFVEYHNYRSLSHVFLFCNFPSTSSKRSFIAFNDSVMQL
uniref:Uncharacterized protein n=1 Tax=Tabanus bromius TaxID=304241 RepID=A0A0K8TP03_TABBR